MPDLVQLPDGSWKVVPAGKNNPPTSAHSPGQLAKSHDHSLKVPVDVSLDATAFIDTAVTEKAIAGDPLSGGAGKQSASHSASSTLPTAPRSHATSGSANGYHILSTEGAHLNCILKRKGFGGNFVGTLQLLEKESGTEYKLWCQTGREGKEMRDETFHFSDMEKAVSAFKSHFQEKTGNKWEDRRCFKPFFGKFVYTPTESDSATASASSSLTVTAVPAMSLAITCAAHNLLDLAKAAKWPEIYKILDKQRELVNVRPEVREYAVLHQAAWHGSEEAVHILMDKYGANPLLLSKSGKCAAQVATDKGRLRIAEQVSARAAVLEGHK